MWTEIRVNSANKTQLTALNICFSGAKRRRGTCQGKKRMASGRKVCPRRGVVGIGPGKGFRQGHTSTLCSVQMMRRAHQQQSLQRETGCPITTSIHAGGLHGKLCNSQGSRVRVPSSLCSCRSSPQESLASMLADRIDRVSAQL